MKSQVTFVRRNASPELRGAFQALTDDATAEVVETIELGLRLPTQGHWADAALGNALHSLLATEFVAPQVPDRVARAQRLLEANGLAVNLTATDVLAAVDRFKATVANRFQPSRILTEVPFTSVNAKGQQLMGFMDLVLETADGWVVIDHKTFRQRQLFLLSH